MLRRRLQVRQDERTAYRLPHLKLHHPDHVVYPPLGLDSRLAPHTALSPDALEPGILVQLVRRLLVLGRRERVHRVPAVVVVVITGRDGRWAPGTGQFAGSGMPVRGNDGLGGRTQVLQREDAGSSKFTDGRGETGQRDVSVVRLCIGDGGRMRGIGRDGRQAGMVMQVMVIRLEPERQINITGSDAGSIFQVVMFCHKDLGIIIASAGNGREGGWSRWNPLVLLMMHRLCVNDVG